MAETPVRKLDLSKPAVMGILNVTPDSFYDGGRYSSVDQQLVRVEQMLEEGASIIDIGAVSTRPGSREICEMTEVDRIYSSLKAIRSRFPEAFISIDTFHEYVARVAVEMGADMINDIYGGRYEEEMLNTVAELQVPYVIMHMKGTPQDMQQDPAYSDVVAEVAYFLDAQIRKLNEKGFYKIIVDPGFGFGKTAAHNFEMLARLEEFKTLGYPVLAGLSRKAMIHKVLDITAGEALNGTSVLNTMALLNGASILRVHDVKEAVEAIRLVEMYQSARNI